MGRQNKIIISLYYFLKLAYFVHSLPRSVMMMRCIPFIDGPTSHVGFRDGQVAPLCISRMLFPVNTWFLYLDLMLGSQQHCAHHTPSIQFSPVLLLLGQRLFHFYQALN